MEGLWTKYGQHGKIRGTLPKSSLNLVHRAVLKLGDVDWLETEGAEANRNGAVQIDDPTLDTPLAWRNCSLTL